MELYATPTAKMDSPVSAQFAGKTAPRTRDSATTELTATSLMLMVEELDRYTSATAAKDGERCGTQNATTTSTMSAAASAHLTAPLV